MVLVIKRGASRRKLKDLARKVKPVKRPGFNAKKYNGKLKLKGDPLEIQKAMRDEWD